MKRIDLDFMATRRADLRWRVVAAVLLFAVAVTALQLHERRSRLDAQIAGISARDALLAGENEPQPAAATALPAPASLALQIPWDGLINALNKSTSAGIVVETVTPDVIAGTVLLDGTANDFTALRAYLDALQRHHLNAPALTSETLDEASGKLHFRIEARWPAGAAP